MSWGFSRRSRQVRPMADIPAHYPKSLNQRCRPPDHTRVYAIIRLQLMSGR